MATPLQIVDPHIHLWDLWTRIYPHFETPSRGRNGSNAAIARSYLLEEFLAHHPDANLAACERIACVLVRFSWSVFS